MEFSGIERPLISNTPVEALKFTAGVLDVPSIIIGSISYLFSLI
jgi:hypothetical protein